MPRRTPVDRARTRVAAGRDAVAAKRAAVEAFLDRAEDLQTASASPSWSGVRGTTSALACDTPTGADHRRTVRRAVAETFRPHSVSDVDGSESPLATTRTEFADSVAVALARLAATCAECQRTVRTLPVRGS